MGSEWVRNAHCRPLANHSPPGQAEATSVVHTHRANLDSIFPLLSSIPGSIAKGDLTLNHRATLFPQAVIHKIGVIRLPLLSRLGRHEDLERSCRREQRYAGPSAAPARAAHHLPSPAELPPPRNAGSLCSSAEPQPPSGQDDIHTTGVTPFHV